MASTKNKPTKLSSFYGSNFQYKIKQYMQEKDGLAEFGVHYSDYAKWGLNPRTEYGIKGVYFYFLSNSCDSAIGKGFATDRKYANIAKINNDRMMIIKDSHPRNFSFRDYERCVSLLKKEYIFDEPDETAINKKALETAGATWAYHLLNLLVKIEIEYNISVNKNLHKLGYDGIVDYDNIILPIESCQGVITWPTGAKWVESIPTALKKNPGTDPYKRLENMRKYLSSQKNGSLKLTKAQIERIMKMVPRFELKRDERESKLDIAGYLAQKLDFEYEDSWKWIENIESNSFFYMELEQNPTTPPEFWEKHISSQDPGLRQTARDIVDSHNMTKLDNKKNENIIHSLIKKMTLQEFNAISMGGGSLASSGAVVGHTGPMGSTSKKSKPKSQLEPIEEATAERDSDFRNEAEEIYNIILNLLSDERDVNYIENSAKRSNQYQGVILDPTYDEEWLAKYPDLFVILAANNLGQVRDYEIQGGFGTVESDSGKKLGVVVIPVLKSPFNLKNVYKRFEVRRNVIIHEFIHYLDFKREKSVKGNEGNKSKKQKINNKSAEELSDEAYYNSPAEYNAYFQEGVHKIEKTLNKWTKSKKDIANLKQYLSSFKSFETLAKILFDPDFVKNLNKTYEKKFLQRLYITYEHFKKQYQFFLNDTIKVNESLVVTESMKNITPDIKVVVDKPNSFLMFINILDEDEDTIAEIELAKSSEEGCNEAWEVIMSRADSGYGPLIYDIAMELAGNSGLMSDREVTSSSARAVWKYYFHKRKDVVKQPVEYDCEVSQKTPMDELNYVYFKKDKSIINQLKTNGQIVMNNPKIKNNKKKSQPVSSFDYLDF